VAIETNGKAWEVISLSDLTDIMKKDNAAAQEAKASPQTGQTRTTIKGKARNHLWLRALCPYGIIRLNPET